ncbi:hypothetical protein [Psilogramma increta granulovirus]|uniref:Uncharacterized protein n=1 Tax=Psilogramma increta granulovirus TaxID=2953508 RepID=A0A977XVI5_9BBAC|nr:hypothetical protein [Psilogramma increta granulovirus]
MKCCKCVPLTKDLDKLLRLKLEHQRKVFHKKRIAKMERDPTETQKQLDELHKMYFDLIVARL